MLGPRRDRGRAWPSPRFPACHVKGTELGPPAQDCPSCVSPPFWASGSTLSSHPPLLIQPVPPGLCRGLAILRALPPTPTRRGGQRETHSSLCHFPSWAAKGPRRQPPAPSLFAHLCLFSFPPRPPLREPHPPAPLMLCRWEQGSPGAPAPLSVPFPAAEPLQAFPTGQSPHGQAFLPQAGPGGDQDGLLE